MNPRNPQINTNVTAFYLKSERTSRNPFVFTPKKTLNLCERIRNMAKPTRASNNALMTTTAPALSMIFPHGHRNQHHEPVPPFICIFFASKQHPTLSTFPSLGILAPHVYTPHLDDHSGWHFATVYNLSIVSHFVFFFFFSFSILFIYSYLKFNI